MIIYGDDSTRLGSDRACVRLNYRVSVHIACGRSKEVASFAQYVVKCSKAFYPSVVSFPSRASLPAKEKDEHTHNIDGDCADSLVQLTPHTLLSSSLPPPVVVAKPPDTVAYQNPCPVSCVPVLFLRGLDIVCRMCCDPARPFFSDIGFDHFENISRSSCASV
jgi:hypothetical protein